MMSGIRIKRKGIRNKAGCGIVAMCIMLAGIPDVPVRAAGEPVGYAAGHPIYENNLLEGAEIDVNEAPGTAAKGRSQAAPAKYDPREWGGVPEYVEDQGTSNTCWAFSAIAAIECNLIKNGYEDKTVNLSENYLAYFFYNRQTDPLGGTQEDKNIAEMAAWDQNGGTIQGTGIFLTTWAGLVKENDLKRGEPYEPEELPEENSYDTDYHVADMYFYDYSVANVKRAILDHGAVTSGIYMDSFDESGAVEGFMEFDENANSWASYSSRDDGVGNHAVAIVGWDDNYSKENFNVRNRPKNDGAWIVRNSWGSGESVGNGYMYVSYEDTSLDEITAFEVIKASEDYMHNYQYDGTGNPVVSMTVEEGDKLANTFVAKGAADGYDERLEAVSIEVHSTWAEYHLEIYAGLTAEGDPESGTLAAEQTGILEDAGSQRIQLKTPVELMAGERYAVVISFENEDETRVSLDCTWGTGWIAFENQTEPYQSYIMEDAEWFQLSEKEGGDSATVRIKAYTNDTEEKTIFSLDKTSLMLKKGSVENLSAIFTPANMERNIRWSSSDERVAVVEDGTVTAAGPGKATVTAAAGEKEVSCEVTVYEETETDQNGNGAPTDGETTARTEQTSGGGAGAAGKTPAREMQERERLWRAGRPQSVCFMCGEDAGKIIEKMAGSFGVNQIY